MATTNVIKWDDTNNRLTAFCSDDTGETEIGPCKWDDTNNRLEINCNSVDATVKWDDTGNNLESRTTDDGCCEEYSDSCPECYDEDQTPVFIEVTFEGIENCNGIDCAGIFNGTFICEDIGNCSWRYLDLNGYLTSDVVIDILLDVVGGESSVQAWLFNPTYGCFVWMDSPTCQDTATDKPNELSCGDPDITADDEGKNGTATWAPL
jgi:hypothetical protein